MSDCMCYVAADPKQPGAAWAICVDDPKYHKETARFVAEAVRKGAHVLRVDKDTGCAMLNKWVRPIKQKSLLPPSPPPDQRRDE